MENGTINIRARRDDFRTGPDTINLFAMMRYQKEIWAVEDELKFVEHKPQTIIKPFINLDNHEAQILMDSLWDCGLRPSEGTGSAGAFAALQNHLKDIKTIAFHALKIKEEGDLK